MLLQNLFDQLTQSPETVAFSDVIALIDSIYDYTPTAFKNGDAENAAGTNAGSCKIFAFAQLHQLSEQSTLALFGHYYREDVLENPDGEDHGNIRNFIKFGWAGIAFEGQPLSERSKS